MALLVLVSPLLWTGTAGADSSLLPIVTGLSSASHPDTTTWYADARPTFSWRQLDGGVLVFDGGSTVAGLRNAPRRSFPSQTVALLPKAYAAFNSGLSHARVTEMIADAPQTVDAHYSADVPNNIVVLYPGINDVMAGATPAELLELVRTYCEARRAVGFDVCVVSLLPQPSEQLEAARQEFNSLLRTRWPEFADDLTDVAADGRIGNPGDNLDPAYYGPDAWHLNDAGAGVLAALLAPHVDTLSDTAAPDVAGYSCLLDRKLDSSPDEVIDLATPALALGPVADGAWYFHVRAVDGLGRAGPTLTRALRIDTGAPTTLALAPATARRGRVAKLLYEVKDPPRGCGAADIVITIRRNKGGAVGKLTLPDRPTNMPLEAHFRCRLAAGAYRFFVYATDEAGNRQIVVGANALVVK